MTDQAYVRYQLQQYVKQAKPGTRIAIFGLTTHLILLQGFNSDPEVLKNVVEHKLLPRSSVLLDDPSGSGSEVPSMSDIASEAGASASAVASMQQFESDTASVQTQIRTQYTLEAFNALARYLAQFPGRKNLIWFSGSFPLTIFPDSSLDDPFSGMADASGQLRETTSLLDRARVAVYPIDARGLQTNPAFSASQSGRGMVGNPAKMMSAISNFNETNAQEHMTMAQIAEDTGGHAFYNTNGLAAAVAKALDAGSNFYTVTYTPSDHNWKHDYRTIQIQLQGPQSAHSYALSYRHSYYAVDPAKLTAKPATATPATPSKDTPATPTTAPPAPPPTTAELYARSAMQRGAPTPSEILFKVRVLPDSTTTSDTVHPHNHPNPNIHLKGPFRLYDIDIAALSSDFRLTTTPDGLHHGAIEFITYVYDADGKLLNADGITTTLNLDAATYTGFVRSAANIRMQVSAPGKAESFLRIAVHDLTSNRFGVVEVPTSTVSKLAPPPPLAPAPAPPAPPVK